MASDEENCVRAISSALNQVARRLVGEVVVDGAIVPTQEAAEFVEMLNALLASQTSEERLRVLLFDVSPTLLATLLELVQTPQLAVAPDTAFIKLLVGSLRSFTRVVSHRGVDGPSYVATLCIDAIVRREGVPAIAAILISGHAPEVQYAAAELLFGLVLRSDAAKRQLVDRDGVGVVVQALGDRGNGQMRCYAAASLREVANGHASALLANDALNVLLRAMSLDASPDVRALTTETVDVFVKVEPQAWVQFPHKKELCSVVTSRLESEQSQEVLEAVLKLLETLLVSDAGHTDPSSADSTFTDYFLSAFGDRFLIATMAHGARVASLAARDLRLLVQLAPYYRYVGYTIFQHFPSLAKLMRVLVQADNIPTPDPVTTKILQVELAIAFSAMLLLDPRCRKSLQEQLESPHWATKVKGALLEFLNAAALEYFAGLNLVDATGQLINDPAAAMWEAGGARPTRQSVQHILKAQEDRWRGSAGDVNPRPPSAITDEERHQTMKLTFILLSYAVHTALPVDRSTPDAAATSRAPARDGEETEVRPQATPAAAPPQPTRSSMLREWQHNPLKQSALQRAAHAPQALDEPSVAVEAAPEAPTPERARDTWHLRAKQHVFSKFDAALKLATHFAQFYNNIGEPQKVIYETDGKFARRQPKTSSWFAGPTPAAKSWSLQQLKEGDLFYFAVPLVSITHFSLEQVRKRALRHMQYAKNSFTVTPQAAKARRWFLYDMLNNCMPGVVALLTELIELCALHGEENVKFPIVMFREQERHHDGPGEASLNSGNLVEVTDQVRFYFQNTVAQQRAAARHSPAEAATSQYLKDVEAKITALQQMRFTGHEKSFLPDLAFEGESSEPDSDEVSVAEPAGRVSTGALDVFDDDDDDDY